MKKQTIKYLAWSIGFLAPVVLVAYGIYGSEWLVVALGGAILIKEIWEI